MRLAVIIFLLGITLLQFPALGYPLLSQQTNSTNRSIDPQTSAEDKKIYAPDSPWLILPLLSSNPKLATAAGLMTAYLHKFDEKSRASLFGISGKYSSTDSLVATIFAKASWKEDHHRLVTSLLVGQINNEYQNYLESGQTVNTQDKIRAAVFRYLYRFGGHWYAGVQASLTNYELLGKSAAEDELLDIVGLVGYESKGIGLAFLYDTRDNDFKPMRGWYLNGNNLAYQASQGNGAFSIYRLDIRNYIPHGQANVLALRQRNQWSYDAPKGAYSPVYLRGYTPGEFLAQYMSSIEIEERLSLSERWTSTGFVGMAKLYGDGADRYDNTNFPAVGLGLQYIMKPAAGIVGNMEYAVGRDNNSGFYIKMGYSF
ncbi:BamA/TamA family outer membrane protein [Bdellovibrio svalbardensis]|uniref:Outer membrane protein assembly factor n=1 Tax=Bdellovibrio svalbardensis TaxID=2972972 RepID=A0ABT6DP31_9BACT|nr:BamA/TamA family outer membrane protein [Bdellovibrio svalbardensis]MDG0817684.1 outer membrane protein assembly factor [Bdellovibrio svalbardensis]